MSGEDRGTSPGRVAPSSRTVAANRAVAARLPLDDPADFERAERGRIAGPDRLVIPHDHAPSRRVWDMDAYRFVSGDAPDTVNPSLWRQAKLNNIHGLFEVTDRIYQVRGYDISNVTFVAGDTGWIVIDPLTSTETARAALELVTAHLGERPVQAVIYTHSHADHFMGVQGVISRHELRERGVPVVAPLGFLEAAVFENVVAGNAMLRRAAFMYGNLLERGPDGQVDCGLGKTVPAGSASLVAPTHLVGTTGEELVLDGVRVVFQYTPDTEAPAEMAFHFPELRALCTAENCTSVMHNLYTLRGAQVRDALAWSKYINESIELFADGSDVLFASHNWPRFGAAELTHYLRTQRDTYRYLHDQTMRLANQGFTPLEIVEQVELPPSLAAEFSSRGYYGTVSHNVRAVYQKYLGFFDGHPAHLDPLPPIEAGARMVSYMGGSDAVLERARADYEAGEYRWVAEVLTHVVFSEPDNLAARELQAAAFEQLAYVAESGPWRNFYLTGALELRGTLPSVPPLRPGARAEVVAALPVDMVFDLLAVRLDGPRADGIELAVNWRFTDTGEEWALRLEHSALNYVARLDESAGVTVTLARTTLDAVLTQQLSVLDALADGDVVLDGNAELLVTLFGLLEPADGPFAITLP
ncbi:MAG: MBL fold metallo-hydrolase [Actinomycetota bacterium]|nr:MBL fold metallo-hydrolase [Actinomycetota bacterium]